MGFFQRILSLFSTVGIEQPKQANGEPLTNEQIKAIDNTVEFHKFLQDEQAIQFTAQAQKTQEMAKTIAELAASVKSLQDTLQAVQVSAQAAAENAATAITAAAAADKRAVDVAMELNKIKGAPMPSKEGDRAADGTPESAGNDAKLKAFIDTRDFFAQTHTLDVATEKAMRITGYEPAQ